MSKKYKGKELAKSTEYIPEKGIKQHIKKDLSFVHFIYLLIISILFLSVYVYIFDEKLDLNGDNAYYYVLGKALSQGEGYVNIANVNKEPNNHYPPGYPFILSLFMHISDSVVFLKIINGIFLLMCLLLFYYLFNHLSGSPVIAFVTVIFLLLNSHLLLYGTMMMSEMSFILFSFLCLIFIQRIDFEKDLFRNPVFYLMMISLGMSYYIRSTGLALFGGLVLYLAIRRHWKAFLISLVGFLMMASPWIVRGHKLGGNSYIKPLVMINPYRPELGNADLADYFNRFFSNISRYITKEIPSSTFPFVEVNYLENPDLVDWIIGLIIIGLIIYGLVKLHSRSLIIVTYLIATCGILLLWPEVWTGVRFVLPIVPILIFSCIFGLYHLIRFILIRWHVPFRFNVLVLLLSGLAFITPIKKIHFKAVNDYPSSWKNYFAIADWFRKEGLKEVVVICRKPMLFYLKSGTYTSTYSYSNDDKALLEDLKARKADYVVLDNLGYRQTYEYLLPAINTNQSFFQVIFKLDNPDTYLLKFNPEH